MSGGRLILSDVHLSRDYGRDTGLELARLLQESRPEELLLAGDIFDLSLDQADVPISKSLQSILATHPEFVAALKQHAERGGKTTLIPGNHDATLSSKEGQELLRRAAEVADERQLEVVPWFARRGDVHVEHGHLYDRDCAPDHPLADADGHSEGLGTALMRRFVAPNDAIIFAHAHKTTPVSGVRTAFEKWGAGAPWVIARYFGTAFALCGEALADKKPRALTRAQGDARLEQHAAQVGLSASALQELLDAAPAPTHHSFRETFLRLYFDRIFAGVSLGVGLSTLSAAGLGLAAAAPEAGGLLATVGGGYLAQSIIRSRSRYAEGPVESVARGAALVREATSCKLVVFGHTHVEVNEPGYINLGSFGFGRPARPYLLVNDQGQHERRYAARE